jgi:hypothetical protein
MPANDKIDLFSRMVEAAYLQERELNEATGGGVRSMQDIEHMISFHAGAPFRDETDNKQRAIEIAALALRLWAHDYT